MKKSVKKIVLVETVYGIFDCVFESNAPEKGFTVTCPKVKGVVTFGETFAEAKRMAKEAIELHCECLVHEGKAEIKIHSN